jgi:hypothetical protein
MSIDTGFTETMDQPHIAINIMFGIAIRGEKRLDARQASVVF